MSKHGITLEEMPDGAAQLGDFLEKWGSPSI